MVTRLKRTGQRSHWIEVSRYRWRYKGNFHGQVIYAPIFEIGRFLSQVAQSLSGLASPPDSGVADFAAHPQALRQLAGETAAAHCVGQGDQRRGLGLPRRR